VNLDKGAETMDNYETNEIEIVYGYLINAFTNAHRKRDKDKADRVYQGVKALRELWPDDCNRWEIKHNKSNEISY